MTTTTTTRTREITRTTTSCSGEPCTLVGRYDDQLESWVVTEEQAGHDDYHHSTFSTRRQAANYIKETCEAMETEAEETAAEESRQALVDAIASKLDGLDAATLAKIARMIK